VGGGAGGRKALRMASLQLPLALARPSLGSHVHHLPWRSRTRHRRLLRLQQLSCNHLHLAPPPSLTPMPILFPNFLEAYLRPPPPHTRTSPPTHLALAPALRSLRIPTAAVLCRSLALLLLCLLLCLWRSRTSDVTSSSGFGVCACARACGGGRHDMLRVWPPG
jgi:hypothetical protein